jgi:hypothetical protein
MAGGTAMAKKAKAKPGPLVTRALKMTESYAEWLERFATRERVTLSSLIDRALSDHAEQTGFDPPPERTP